ncbi:hypothetical protein R0J93_28650, partial [Pseudoalteromonas sp. SIMBA_148]
MQEGRSDEGDGEQQGVPQRELNLTWHRDLPGHNRLSAGEWAPISDFADADSEARSRLAAA